VTALPGGLVDRLVLAGVAVGAALMALLVARRWPRVGVTGWLLITCFVPVWIGVKVVFLDLPPGAGAALVLLLAVGRVLPRRLTVADLLVGALVLIGVASAAAGFGSLSTAVGVVFYWAAIYLLGRTVPERVDLRWLYGCVSLVLALVGGLAVLEFVLRWNPFVGFGNGSAAYALWGQLQERGGIVRAEGAFGHSIALGSSMALGIPLALGSGLRPRLRAAVVLLLTAGAVVSFSRAALACVALGVVLVVAFGGSFVGRRWRWTLGVGVAVAAPVVAANLLGVFSAAGTEAANSAWYRLRLTDLLDQVAFVGLSPSARRDPSGAVYFGSFRSIDSALLYLGLTYGALALALALLLLLMGCVTVFRGRATPPVIAVVAQLPALASVALITQYGILFWFVAGLAVSSMNIGRLARSDSDAAVAHLDSGGRRTAAVPAGGSENAS
jgi:hypothetical protein